VVQSDTWCTNIVNYLVTGMIPKGWNTYDKDRVVHLVKFYIWDDPYLFEYYSNKIVRRCVPDHKAISILSFSLDQACGEHFSGKATVAKVL